MVASIAPESTEDKVAEPIDVQSGRGVENRLPAERQARPRVHVTIVHSHDDDARNPARWLASKILRKTATIARKFEPTTLLPRLKRKTRQLKWRLKQIAETRASVKAIKTIRPKSCCYDVLCLPVMPWNSRVQRPQQLMRQFARHGHRVFYASLAFQAGDDAAVAAVAPNVFETILPGAPHTNVYGEIPSEADVDRMVEAVNRLRIERRITSAVVVVQLPFWTKLAEKLRERFGFPIVYDCMDDHAGFSTNCPAMLAEEDRLVAEADLVAVTAEALREKVASKSRRTALVRNACDYEHFAHDWPELPKVTRAGMPLNFDGEILDDDINFMDSPHEVSRAQASPAAPVVGFYGAIAEWFDADLVADLAESRPDWRFELIGDTHTGDTSRLDKLPNVALLGEQPYDQLPRLVSRWACHIIPFKRIPLTEATNPVKAYEMLATGKPVVAVDLPELRPMAAEGLLTVADDARQFAEAIESAMSGDDGQQRERRQAFAAANTWEKRWSHFDRAIREAFPPASILTATYNNLTLNKAWLQSILAETDYPNYEVIVVDNGSTDGTAEWLIEAARDEPRLRVICNRENRGFAAANNQALRRARGEFLCLLNNDTIVTRGWLSTLIGHLRREPRLGLVGPASNSVGNDAKVPVNYKDLGQLPRWAEDYCRRHDGETVPLDMLGFFCVVMPREVYERIGELDERFGLGCFEDDDYCRRLREAGYEMRFARDSFVHHWREASFRLLGEDLYLKTFFENQRRFEAKWNGNP